MAPILRPADAACLAMLKMIGRRGSHAAKLVVSHIHGCQGAIGCPKALRSSITLVAFTTK